MEYLFYVSKSVIYLFFLFNKFWIGCKRDDEMVNDGFLHFPFFFFSRDLAAQS